MTDHRHARKTEVRARMATTGENYTAAAAALATKHQRDATAREQWDRADRYDRATDDARQRTAVEAHGLWADAYGVRFPPGHRVEGVLLLPNGDTACWTTYTPGGRELAEEIDRQAAAAGLTIVEHRVLRQRYAHTTEEDPLTFHAWDLSATLAAITRGDLGTEEERAHVTRWSVPLLGLHWMNVLEDTKTRIDQPQPTREEYHRHGCD